MESQKPVVSILMTVFNRESYLVESIESVIASTYRNWELIIADDCSTDRSVEIAEMIAKNDSRITVYKYDKNVGDYPNRNRAATQAIGKYIKYLDSDDILYPHGLEVMVEAMERLPEAAIGFSDMHYTGDKPFPYAVSPEEAYHRHFFGKGFLYHGPTGCIYRTEVFKDIGGFNEEFGVASDLEFNFRMCTNNSVCVFNRDLYWWRIHGDQEINRKQSEYESLNHRIYSMYLTSSSCPLNEKAPAAYKNHLALKARRVLQLVLSLRYKKAVKLMKVTNLKPGHFVLAFLPSRKR